MMSRGDLDAIQLQLKTAIQSHQILVTKMKGDPQSVELRKQLHDLQREITALSEKQKVIVQNLRKELVSNHRTTEAPATIPQAVPPMSAVVLRPATVTPAMSVMVAAPTVAMSMQMSAATVVPILCASLPTASTTVPVVNVPVASHVQPIQPKPMPMEEKASCQSTTIVPSRVKSEETDSKASVCSNNVSQSAQTQRSTSPPIRVPQYSLHRPSILQGNKSSNAYSSSSTSNLSRRPSDSDIRDIRKTVERKQVSPEEKEKLAYMAVLELVTQDTLKEMQSRKHERKRRTTANPMYNFEPEVRRRPTSLVLNNSLSGLKRPRGRPPKHAKSPSNSHPGTPDSADSNSGSYRNGLFKNGCTDDVHEDFCAVCGLTGQLLLCDTCSKVYHLQCLDPPLPCVPDGRWSCIKCMENGKSSAWSPGTLAMVHSFIANKAAKEEERKKMHKKSLDLNLEMSMLENKTKQLSEALMQQRQKREELMESHRHAQQSVDNIKNFIKVIQSS